MIAHHVIGLVYTRTCPLACAHCISESSPQARGRMTPEQVRRYLPAIRRFTRILCFTGGEPLLFHDEIVELTGDARRIGLDVCVVTGAGWVKNESMARARIRQLATAGVSRIVVSWDAYHEEFAPREHAEVVVRAALDAGMAVEVRGALTAGQRLEDYRAPFAELGVVLQSTPLIKLGTARSLPSDHFQWWDEPPKGLCNVVTRPVIEPDGTVYACCGPGHFANRPSPLVLGNAEETPLDEILARGARDPILEAITLIGPAGLQQLLGEPPGRRRYTGICEVCLDLNSSPDRVRALRKRLEDPDARIQLAAAGMWLDHKRGQASSSSDGRHDAR